MSFPFKRKAIVHRAIKLFCHIFKYMTINSEGEISDENLPIHYHFLRELDLQSFESLVSSGKPTRSSTEGYIFLFGVIKTLKNQMSNRINK